MVTPTAARQHYNSQQKIAGTALRQARSLWARVGADLDAGWSAVGADMAGAVNGAMVDAARDGADYVPRILAETRQSDEGLRGINAVAFSGWTRQGAPVAAVLHGAVRTAKQALADGHTLAGAHMLGRRSLDRVVPTLVADAGGQAAQVASTTATRIGGYVRMVGPSACRRCIILAGRWYAWNEGFQRHPHCMCRHIPASEDVAGDWRTDPYELFNRMSTAEQDRVFGKSEARAIRDGADMSRVVNVRQRGLPTARAYKAPRMTVDEIYRNAGTRTNALRMLTEQGYILPGGQQRGGVIGYGALGLDSRAAHQLGAGAMGRGGTRRGATIAHRTAARTGIRDQLDPATQTVAERRLHRAVTASRAVAEGRNPYGTHRLTDKGRERAARDLDDELRALRAGTQPRQVHKLADRLGITL